MVIIFFIFFWPLCSFTTNTLAISSTFLSAPPREIFAVPGENNGCYCFQCGIYYRLKVFFLLKCLSNKV